MESKDDELGTITEEEIREATPGKGPVTHGVVALQKRGPAAMVKAEQELYLRLVDDLGTREGIADQVRRRAARSIIIVERVEAFVAEQLRKGKKLDRVKIFQNWPKFQNAASRALSQAKQMLPPSEAGRYDAELERIRQIVEILPDELTT